MDVTKLPFNHLIGIELGDPGSDFLISLPDDVKYTNHLGTVHASALFAVAEAASGLFLLRHFGADAGLVPGVRRWRRKNRPAGRQNWRGGGGSWHRCRLKSWELTGRRRSPQQLTGSSPAVQEEPPNNRIQRSATAPADA